MKSVTKQYKKNSKRSLCKSKKEKKCNKLKGCKYTSKGTKRKFCRKKKNKSYKKKGSMFLMGL